MTVNRACLTTLILLIPFLAAGQVYQTESGYAEFTGDTPMFSFEGSSDSLSGSVNVTDSTVQFKLPVKTLDTGNNKRDRDMMRTLEAGKYPEATFEGKITSSFNRDKLDEQEVTVKGTFTIHGVSQSLKILGTMQFEGDQLKITASWEQKLTDYNMEPPSVLFYSMDDQIAVRVEASLYPATTSS
jgi:polyisoprenoid-binding protein YceI